MSRQCSSLLCSWHHSKVHPSFRFCR
jgi:hypothetical protein